MASPPKKPAEVEDDLSYQQAIQYAKELNQLYRRERDQREKLEVAYAEVKKLNEELQRLRGQLEQDNRYLREEVSQGFALDRIIGASPLFRDVLRQVEAVAQTDVSVLLEGETGVGKELIARAIHERSRRNARPLVKVNCGAIPRELFESEFFGHVKGSFTGAVKDRVGRFQIADKGSLFLDEVGDIPLELQGKLLRVLQEGEYEPVGEDRTRRVDVRVIAATNRDLLREAEQGRFREDLYYRLSVMPIKIPPLRLRQEDVGPLAQNFLDAAAVRFNIKKTRLTEEQLHVLREYPWPGNIRELHNVIERSILLSRGKALEFDLPRGKKSAAAGAVAAEPALRTVSDQKADEKENLLAALQKTNWKIYGPRGAAEILGINPATLAYRIKKLGLKKP